MINSFNWEFSENEELYLFACIRFALILDYLEREYNIYTDHMKTPSFHQMNGGVVMLFILLLIINL